jgi:hypothetical protein
MGGRLAECFPRGYWRLRKAHQGAECPLPDAEFVPQVNELHMLREELEERIKPLVGECRTDWEAERSESEGKFSGIIAIAKNLVRLVRLVTPAA